MKEDTEKNRNTFSRMSERKEKEIKKLVSYVVIKNVLKQRGKQQGPLLTEARLYQPPLLSLS